MKFFLFFALPCMLLISSCSKNDVTIDPETPIDPNLYTVKDTDPSWSPDGKSIVYYTGGPAEVAGLYIIDTNGNNKRRITHLIASNPRWSPDGQWIVFDYQGHIYKKGIGVDTSIVKLTTSGVNGFPSWSYDGQWIAYEARTDESFAYIWKMRPDGSAKKRIIYSPNVGEVRCPDWFPDGIRLAVARYFPDHGGSTEIAVIDTLGNSIISLTNDRVMDLQPRVSSDNTIVFYHDVNWGQISSVKANGTEFTFITSDHSYYPSWSPDGKMIAYTNSTYEDGRIWLMKKDGTGRRKLTN